MCTQMQKQTLIQSDQAVVKNDEVNEAKHSSTSINLNLCMGSPCSHCMCAEVLHTVK